MSTPKTFPDGTALKRYDLSSVDGLEGWASIALGADGFFAAVSDYGNYGHGWWHFGEGDFRDAVIRFSGDPGYVLCKISREEFDLDATVKAIRERIDALKEAGALTEDDADSEHLTADGLESDGDFGEWLRETNLEEAHDYHREEYPNDARAFAEKTMPRLAEMLRAEIEAERKAA